MHQHKFSHEYDFVLYEEFENIIKKRFHACYDKVYNGM